MYGENMEVENSNSTNFRGSGAGEEPKKIGEVITNSDKELDLLYDWLLKCDKIEKFNTLEDFLKKNKKHFQTIVSFKQS